MMGSVGSCGFEVVMMVIVDGFLGATGVLSFWRCGFFGRRR
jgi:hypothetical protein